MPTKVYKYPANAPATEADIVHQQIRLGHRYKNKLVELERLRREEVAAATREFFPRLLELDGLLEAAEQTVERLSAAIKTRNAGTRKRTATAADRQALAQARQVLRELRAESKQVRLQAYGPVEVVAARLALKAARKDGSTALVAAASAALEQAETVWYEQLPQALALRSELDRIDALHGERGRGARGESGLYWGTYLTVEASMAAARKGAPPRFRRFDGEGKISVRIQDGLSVPDLLGGNGTVLQLRRDEGSANPRHFVCQFRVGSRGREPIFATIPIQMGRPLPADALITWANLVLRRIGPRQEWSIHFTVNTEEGFARPDRAAEGAVALDLGWRLLGDGQRRIAYWLGTDGEQGQLVIPSVELTRWDHADALQRPRSILFNQGQAILMAWLAGSSPPAALMDRAEWLRNEAAHERRRAVLDEEKRLAAAQQPGPLPAGLPSALSPGYRRRRADGLDAEALACAALLDDFGVPDLPDWTCEATETLSQWRSAPRLGRLLERWRTARFAGDERVFPVLDGWRRADKHLWEWQASVATRAQRWRKDVYRKFALWLMRRYHKIVLPSTDWRAFLTAQQPDDVGDANRPRPAKLAALGELAECLRSVAGEFVKAPALNITRLCHVCEHIEDFDAKTELVHRCGQCGDMWDQGYNACVNLLRASGEEVEEFLVSARGR